MKGTRSVLSVMALALTVVWAGCSSTTSTGGEDGGISPPDLVVPGPPPMITEFLAKNQAGLTDEDGSTSDWIEIHNPGTAPLDLSGYHLTDSKSNLTRWAFPEGTLMQPGAYMVAVSYTHLTLPTSDLV